MSGTWTRRGPATAHAAVTADTARTERIAGELADVRGTLAREVVRDGYGDQ
ncbi:hypothetical protein [Streptomyces canus]|uniref:hypothetical protein n=1 Tax=Streptomyces canus TaxID=58343 RepID=UPI002E304713|nr:hypothetical protein [Streptomyces canus]